MRRRRFLRVAATAGVIGIAGCSNDSGPATDRATRQTATNRTTERPTGSSTNTDPSRTRSSSVSPTGTTESTEVATEEGWKTDDATIGDTTTGDTTVETTATRRPAGSETQREEFLWAEQSLWRDERTRENLFSYASHHDLAVVIAHANANHADIEARLETPLSAARDHGVEAWLNTGVLSAITAETFVDDADARATHLDRLGRAATTLAEYAPEGRMILWQEAPVGGEWIEGGAWNDAAVTNLREHGPRIFAAQKQAVAEAVPGLDVGIFIHFPYIVDSKKPEVFAGLMDDLRANDALAEFVFTDFYRGWYEKDAGPETANRAVRSLITNAREHADGRDVLYMGGAHTINPHHTPSRQSIRMDLRASTGVDADGLGWYTRTAYKTTQQGFDPFVPNRTDPERVSDGPRASTATFARDRYQYAYAALRETRPGYDPSEYFDLWLVGEGFSFYDHRLSLRDRSGEWAFVGDFDGYPAGTRPTGSEGTSKTRRRVSVFRGLDRERFFGGGGTHTHTGAANPGTLALRIETRAHATGAWLDSVVVTPAGTGGYLTEPAAAAVLDARDDIEAFALGRKRVATALGPGGSVRVGVSVAGETQRPLVALAHPGDTKPIARLCALERATGFDPGERFDLWIEAHGLDDVANPAERLSIPAESGGDAGHTLADAGVAVSTAGEGTVAYGLDRENLLDQVAKRGIAIEGGSDGVELRAAYAMPYFGSRNFVSAAEAISTVAADRGEARTYSLKHTKLGYTVGRNR